LVGGDLPDDDEDDQEDYQEVPQGKKVGVCDFAGGPVAQRNPLPLGLFKRAHQ
jgi:hypothetical protein